MAITYEPLASTTLTASSSSLAFGSIPNTYTDLRLVIFGVYTGSSILKLNFNSDISSNYSNTRIGGNGAGGASDRSTNQTFHRLSYDGYTSSNPNLLTVDIFSYAGSTNKSCLITNSDDKNGSGAVYSAVGLWRNTAAINTITVVPNSSEMAAGTVATLYGILKA
jgi:hypothetical protein